MGFGVSILLYLSWPLFIYIAYLFVRHSIRSIE
jgi:hypothetical protein